MMGGISWRMINKRRALTFHYLQQLENALDVFSGPCILAAGCATVLIVKSRRAIGFTQAQSASPDRALVYSRQIAESELYQFWMWRYGRALSDRALSL